MCRQNLIDVSHEQKQATPVPEIEIHPVSEESDLGVCNFLYLLFDQGLTFTGHVIFAFFIS